MKKLLVLLSILLGSFMANSRELTDKEKLVLLPVEKTKYVQTWIVENIDHLTLSFGDYIIFQELLQYY